MAPDFLAGGGECGALIRAKDWSRTSLGPPERWPRALQTMVAMILASRQPMFVWWGPDLVNLHNDAYRSAAGNKHPHGIGARAGDMWREIWDQIGPRLASARENVGTFDEALLLVLDRHGYREETYYTFSYTPVRGDDGAIGGLLGATREETKRIQDERQVALQRELAAVNGRARTIDAACRLCAEILAEADRDLPFVGIYRVDTEQRRFVLAGAAGFPPGHAAAPPTIPFGEPLPWPLEEALAGGRMLSDLTGALPTGAWDEPPSHAAVLPIPSSDGTAPIAVLVAGLNPFRLIDDGFRGFLALVVQQIAATLANARATEDERARVEGLAALDRAKTTFFGNVSHEFRTPLTLMLGPLRDALASPERALAGPDLDAAFRNALRLLRLTNALLDFSRFEAGRAHGAFEPTDLSRLTSGVASVFRSLVEGAGLSYTVEDTPLPHPVHVDRTMWEKVVLNLVSNAFKHTFEGGISVSLRDEGDAAVLRVADTGIGIEPAHLPRVFDRFHRVAGARARTHEGTGIGLTLVKEVAQLHGGRIDVQSTSGAGSVFTVTVPYGTAHLPADRLVPGRPLVPGQDPAPYLEEASGWVESPDTLPAVTPDAQVDRSIRVLVVDDNGDMRRYVSRLLARCWTVETAPDGEAALARALAAPPDLVLTDVMMPRLDGFQLLGALRDDPRTRAVPVILLSARAGEEARIQGLAAGADDYLVKPFTAEELCARVRSQVELSRMRRAREREIAALNEALELRVAARTVALEEQAAELRAVNLELSAFTYTIAHDLRAPLRSMHRFGEVLVNEYGGALDGAGRSYADRIVAGARKMDDLIRGLLDYTRIKQGPLRRERIDVGEAIAELCVLIPDQCAHVRVEGPLPSVVGDPVLFYQVLANLLSNAGKFVAPGVTPRVEVRAERHGAMVHVLVEDNGIGIAPEHRDRIFGVFERLNHADAFEGTGIGLAIAARAAERMGGSLGVTSEPGVGSRFWLALPGSDP